MQIRSLFARLIGSLFKKNKKFTQDEWCYILEGDVIIWLKLKDERNAVLVLQNLRKEKSVTFEVRPSLDARKSGPFRVTVEPEIKATFEYKPLKGNEVWQVSQLVIKARDLRPSLIFECTYAELYAHKYEHKKGSYSQMTDTPAVQSPPQRREPALTPYPLQSSKTSRSDPLRAPKTSRLQNRPTTADSGVDHTPIGINQVKGDILNSLRAEFDAKIDRKIEAAVQETFSQLTEAAPQIDLMASHLREMETLLSKARTLFEEVQRREFEVKAAAENSREQSTRIQQQSNQIQQLLTSGLEKHKMLETTVTEMNCCAEEIRRTLAEARRVESDLHHTGATVEDLQNENKRLFSRAARQLQQQGMVQK